MLHRALFVLSLAACTADGTDAPEPDDTDEALPIRSLQGCARLPDGVQATTILNAFSEVTPDAEGCYTVDLHAERPQLTFALSADGHPMRMGWISPERPDLDARITAESLAWFAIGGPNAGLEATPKLFELLADAGDPVDRLADALDAAISADPNAFADTHAATATVMAEIAAELLGTEPDQSPPPANLVLYNPSDEQSGLRMLTTSGVNAISLQNSLRRAGHLFVDRVSTFDEDGNETASPKEITDRKVGAVQSLQGWTDAFSQIVTAEYSPGGLEGSEDVAYVPRTVGPIQLENVEGAAKTRYRVAVVGPGVSDGALGDLPSSHATQQVLTSVEFLVMEAFIPVLNQIVIPNLGIDQLYVNDLLPSLVADIAKLVTSQIPRAGQLMAAGDSAGAIAQLWDAFAGSGVLRDAVMDLIVERFYDFRTEALANGTDRATALAAGFARVTGAVDALLTGADATFIATSVGQSNRGDVWTVDVADATIRMEPREARVSPETRARFQVHVPEAGDDVAFEYRFRANGAIGTLESATGSGSEVTTSQPWVDLVAATDEAEGSITVEVFEIRLSQRVQLGDATSAVTVTDDCEDMTPQRPSYTFIDNTFTCFVDDLCSKAWPVFTFRPVPTVFAYQLTADTHGNDRSGFRSGSWRINLFANTGQPGIYYYNNQRANNYLPRLVEVYGQLADTQLIYVPEELHIISTHVEENAANFERIAADLDAEYGTFDITITPICPGQ